MISFSLVFELKGTSADFFIGTENKGYLFGEKMKSCVTRDIVSSMRAVSINAFVSAILSTCSLLLFTTGYILVNNPGINVDAVKRIPVADFQRQTVYRVTKNN